MSSNDKLSKDVGHEEDDDDGQDQKQQDIAKCIKDPNTASLTIVTMTRTFNKTK